MKTKNNVQKAVLRSAAVIVSFVLISLTVSAQDFWKRLITNSSFNEIAIAMVETSKKSDFSSRSLNENSINLILNEAVEPALDLEAWMTNEGLFNKSTFQTVNEKENELELEDWMVNENFFNTTNNCEQALELEGWMTSDKFWKS